MLIYKKVQISVKYLNLLDVFLKEIKLVLPELTKLISFFIKFQDNKQPIDRLIHSLKSIKLKTLKIYIKTDLANNFIEISKLRIKALIIFF